MIHFRPTEAEVAAGSLSLFVSTCSLICTSLTLWVISAVKRNTSYNFLVLGLTLGQLIYDVGLVLIPLYWVQPINYATIFLGTIGGISTSLLSNLIAYIVYYVVYKMKALDIRKYYVAIWLGVCVPSLSLGIGLLSAKILSNEAETQEDSTYYQNIKIIFNWVVYSIRVASILVNLVLFGFIMYRVRAMGFRKNIGPPNDLTQNQGAVLELVNRLKYYFIVQTISRLGASWYEAHYGWETKSYDNNSPEHVISLLFYAFFTPIAGIGYFIIYLNMQPYAYAYLQTRFWKLLEWYWPCCLPCCLQGCCCATSFKVNRAAQDDMQIQQRLLSPDAASVQLEKEMKWGISNIYNIVDDDDANGSSHGYSGAVEHGSLISNLLYDDAVIEASFNRKGKGKTSETSGLSVSSGSHATVTTAHTVATSAVSGHSRNDLGRPSNHSMNASGRRLSSRNDVGRDGFALMSDEQLLQLLGVDVGYEDEKVRITSTTHEEP